MPTHHADIPCYGACAYGFNVPGCFLWARVFPNGRVFVQADIKFVHKPIEVVAGMILRETSKLGLTLHTTYADPALFPDYESQKVGATLEAEAPSETFARFDVPMVASGSDRVHGAQRIHDYLRDAPDGKPWLVFSPAAKVCTRTLPGITQTKANPDDYEGDEYAVNALRALLSAMPSPGHGASAKPSAYEPGTVGYYFHKEPKRGLLARRRR